MMRLVLLMLMAGCSSPPPAAPKPSEPLIARHSDIETHISRAIFPDCLHGLSVGQPGVTATPDGWRLAHPRGGVPPLWRLMGFQRHDLLISLGGVALNNISEEEREHGVKADVCRFTVERKGARLTRDLVPVGTVAVPPVADRSGDVQPLTRAQVVTRFFDPTIGPEPIVDDATHVWTVLGGRSDWLSWRAGDIIVQVDGETTKPRGWYRQVVRSLAKQANVSVSLIRGETDIKLRYVISGAPVPAVRQRKLKTRNREPAPPPPAAGAPFP